MAFHHTIIVVFLAALCLRLCWSQKLLNPNHYDSSCPKATTIVANAVGAALKNKARTGASLLRLHFHDCFVNGCDGSVLLKDTKGFIGEQTAAANNRSISALNVVDNIKAQLEKACPKVVSCADILALSARDSVVQLGGPSWTVGLGRRDSKIANLSAANAFIPAPSSNLTALTSSFARQGLTFKEMVALSGGHTIGLARCASFRARLYNETNINNLFATSLKKTCPKAVGQGDDVHQRLDVQSSTVFDNRYYQNLVAKKGLLHSDQALFNGGSADSLVKKYASDQTAFFADFASAMRKMSNINPVTGKKQGQIRIQCGRVN